MRYPPNWDCKDRKLFGYDKLICRIFFLRGRLFPLPGVKDGFDLAEILPFVELRGIDPGLGDEDLFAVGAVEGMGHERTAHEVVLDLPHTAYLRDLAALVLDVFERGREVFAGGHIGAVEHSRNVLLEDLVAVLDDLFEGEGIVFDRVTVHEDVLIDLLVVRDPDEGLAGLAELVAAGEVRRAAEQRGDLLVELAFFVAQRVADHAVTLRLLEGIDDGRSLLLEKLGGLRGRGSAQLDDALRGRPDVAADHEAGRIDLRIHLEEDDVAVDLEHIHEGGGHHVDEREERLLLGEPGAVAREHLADVAAQGVLPVGLLHHDDDLTGLSADGGKRHFGFFAGRQQQRGGQQQEEEVSCLHILLMDESCNVVAEGQEHQAEDEDHSDQLGDHEEALAGLAPGNDLKEREEDVPAVQARDGQEVHHAQHNGQQGEDVQEAEPVPGLGEDLSDGDEAAHGLVGAGGRPREQRQVVEVASDGGARLPPAGGNGFQQVVVPDLDAGHLHQDADAAGAVHAHGDAERVAAADHRGGDFLRAHLGEQDAGILDEFDALAVVGHDAVAPRQVGAGVESARHHGVHDDGDGQVEHHRVVEDFADAGPVDVDVEGVGAAQDRGLAHVAPGEVRLQHPEVLRLVVVEAEDLVAVAEAHLVGEFVHVDLVAAVLDIGVAPDGHDGDVGEDGEDEVVDHAAGHHQQALPGRVRAELPGLGLFLELLEVHRFVHHSGDLAVAAEGEPADAELRLTPVPAGKRLAAHVEEEVELLHADLEQACPQEMTELVDDDEYGQGEDNLQRFNEYNHRQWQRLRGWLRKCRRAWGSLQNSGPRAPSRRSWRYRRRKSGL